MARILRINKIQTTFCINERFERRKVNTLKEKNYSNRPTLNQFVLKNECFLGKMTEYQSARPATSSSVCCSKREKIRKKLVGWLVDLGLTALLDSIWVYIGLSPRDREKVERRTEESKNVQTTLARTYCKYNRPLPSCHPFWRTPRHPDWKLTQHHRKNICRP